MKVKKSRIVVRVFTISLVLGVVGMIFALSTPESIDQEQLKKASDVLGVSTEEVLANYNQQLIIQNIFDGKPEPDFTIEEVDFYFDEQNIFKDNSTNSFSAKELVLTRTLTYDDGTQNIDTIKPSFLNTVSLDFIAVKDDIRPIANGKINYQLSLDVTKEISIADGEFSIFFDQGNVKLIVKKLTNADVKNGKLIIFDQTLELNNLIATSSPGLHKLELRLDKFFIIYADNSREYANPNQILHTVEFEKNLDKTIKKDEYGNYVKVFDFDVPITVSASAQSVKVSYCLSGCRGGGCCSSYSDTGVVPAPPLGAVSITDLSTNKIVAHAPASPGGSCYGSFGYTLLSGSLTSCRYSEGGSSLAFNAQRGQSYRIDVTDPLKSWVINVPESGGAYHYSCITDATKEDTQSQSCTQNGGCTTIYSISSSRSCNFP